MSEVIPLLRVYLCPTHHLFALMVDQYRPSPDPSGDAGTIEKVATVRITPKECSCPIAAYKPACLGWIMPDLLLALWPFMRVEMQAYLEAQGVDVESFKADLDVLMAKQGYPPGGDPN